VEQKGEQEKVVVSNQRHTAAEQTQSSITTRNKNITHATKQQEESERGIDIKELISTSLLPYANSFRSYRESNEMIC
jgi:hypothetical protein